MSPRRLSDDAKAMSHHRYRKLLNDLGLSQNKASEFLYVDPRTSRRWALAEIPVPPVVAMLLALMVEKNCSPKEARALAKLEDFDHGE